MKYDYKTINTETLKGLEEAEELQKQGWDVANVGMFSIQFKRQTPLAMKTNINRKLVTVQDAKDYLTELHNNKETYHPEDNAANCFDISEADAEKMNNLMSRVYELFTPEKLDPCEFLLKLDPDYKME